jgi:hypothetical protein
MLKVIFLLGEAERLVGLWTGDTSRRRRILVGFHANFIKAQVQILENKEVRGEFPFFWFVKINSVKKIPAAIKKVEDLLEEKISKEETLVIVSRQDNGVMEEMDIKKLSKRYHYDQRYGWLMILKGKMKNGDVSEIVGKFFKEQMLESDVRYQDIDVVLSSAKQKRF